MTTSLQCTAPQCAFKTMQGTVDQVLQHLSLHAQTAHPVQQAQGGGTARGKVDRPTMKPACDQESWAFFLYDWDNYKSAMNITGNAISAHLFGCLDEELKRDLQKAHQGVAAATMSEADLLQAIKRLAVKEESKLTHRIKMGRATQQPGASIRTFHAHLKGLAAPCEYQTSHTCGCGKTNDIDYSDNVIQDQLVRGIADQEILADLLGDEKSDRTTKEIVEFIARKEQAKIERETVSSDAPSVAAASVPGRGDKVCRGCDGKDHGSRSKRLKECPARDVTCERCKTKGHFTRKCIKCRDCHSWGHSSRNSRHCGIKESKDETGVINVIREDTVHRTSTLAHIERRADKHLALVCAGKKKGVPLTHHIFTHGS